MIRLSKVLFLIIGILLLLVCPNFAEPISKLIPIGYVNDFANLITSGDQNRLNIIIKNLKDQTTAEIAIVTIKSTDSEPIENYAVKLFEKWGIGQKGKDNGILVLVAVNDRNVRIEVGYGLEGAVTDAISRNIIETYFVPNFKQGNYSTAILSGVQAIVALCAKEYGVNISSVGSEYYKADYTANRKKGSLIDLILMILFFIFIFSSRSGFLSYLLFGSMFSRRGYSGGYGSSSGSFGGGFGGFGGGSSGGGGASGSW